MNQDRLVLTTGQIAKKCNVAPRTVSLWIDSGKLLGYRLPGSKDRRVTRTDFENFIKAEGIRLQSDPPKCVLLAGLGPDATKIAERFRSDGYTVQVTTSTIETAIAAGANCPSAIVIDMAMTGRDEVLNFAQIMRGLGYRLVALANEDEADPSTLYRNGFTLVVFKPYDAADLIKAVWQVRS